jgi:hypothetical protein
LRRFIGHSLVHGALRLRTFWVSRRFSGLHIKGPVPRKKSCVHVHS